MMGGAAGRADLLRHCTRWNLNQAVRNGHVQQIGRGRYALPALPEGLKIAAAERGKLSHQSAAQFWLLEAIAEPNRVHITVPPNAHRSALRSVIFHYADTPGDALVTPPLHTVLDCARTLPFNEALAIADSALRRELIDRAGLGQREVANVEVEVEVGIGDPVGTIEPQRNLH